MRHLRFSLAIGVCLILFSGLWLSVHPVFAATFTVNDNGDGSDSNTGDGVCNNGSGVCTLRAAIGQANALAGPDVINFSGGMTINIASEISISSDITINGTGVTVDNTGSGRIFNMNAGTVVMNGITITGGDASLGAGIYISGGNLTLQNGVTVTGNAAGTTSGNRGSGLAASGAGTTVLITGSTTSISGNGPSWGGSGMYAFSGATLTVSSGARVSDNETSGGGNGGGASLSGATLIVDGGVFSGNTVASSAGGGGIYGQGSAVITLQNGAVISGNQAAFGGAIFTGAVTLSISDSRIESNTATTAGGAIYYSTAANANIVRSCFTSNGDTAVMAASTGVLDASGGGNIANANWWGTDWGPRIAAAGGGSAVSNGDSISGNGSSGANLVDVDLTNAGNYNTPPTGAWLTTAPTINGVQCQTCVDVSSVGHGRTCS